MRKTCSFLFYIRFTFAHVFYISRQGSGKDSFNVPASICSNPGHGCSSFYAAAQNSCCSCLCPATKATFTFANNRWVCMSNARARRHLQQGECLNTKTVSTKKKMLKAAWHWTSLRKFKSRRHLSFQKIVTLKLTVFNSLIRKLRFI